MREIKFRLIKDGQIVGYERWNPEYRRWEYIACDPQGITPKGAIWMQPEIGYIEHDSKDWFTGLHDKNGIREIYEGDIVNARGGECCQGFWEFSKNGVVIKDMIGDTFELGHYEYLCVIGNIHDNPDLLKGVIPCKE